MNQIREIQKLNMDGQRGDRTQDLRVTPARQGQIP